MGNTVKNGVISWLRQRNVDAVVCRAKNVIGWLGLSEIDYQKKLAAYQARKTAKAEKAA